MRYKRNLAQWKKKKKKKKKKNGIGAHKKKRNVWSGKHKICNYN